MSEWKFVSKRDLNCVQPVHQVQLINMQKFVELTWVPNIAGYDTREQNNKGILVLIWLDNAAMTFLTMAATPKFAAAALPGHHVH